MTFARMAESIGKIVEGVFAISKPPSLSSAQVLRDLQQTFSKSKTFAPLREQSERLSVQDGHRSKRRKIDRDNVFRMGHGGTLDPMATGVLIVGIGRGTKQLGTFLDCTKTYDTVVLFGKGTDTYDAAGKIVCEAPHKHISEELVEEKLANFRGKIKQVPPIYSALKINGIKAYDYAREGKELPRELASRDMEVSQCTLLDWYERGQHEFRWPSDEAPEEEKDTMQKLMPGVNSTDQDTTEIDQDTKDRGIDVAEPTSQFANQEPSSDSVAEKAALHTHKISTLSSEPADGPAARIRLTVSSGFYVRSFAHDLGVACNSYAMMSELIRSRQADFTLLDPAPEGLVSALEYEDLEKGEEIWGPKIVPILQNWQANHPIENRMDDRDRHESQNRFKHGSRQKWRDRNPRGKKSVDLRRRNSSSPD